MIIVEHHCIGYPARMRRRARITGLQLAHGIYLNHEKVDEYLDRQWSFDDLQRYRTIYISTWEQFYPSDGFEQKFVPLQPLRACIRSGHQNR